MNDSRLTVEQALEQYGNPVRQHRGCMDFRPLDGWEPCATCGAVPQWVERVRSDR